MLVSSVAAPPLPQVAWMNVPDWCKPARNSLTARFIKKCSKGCLFLEANANNSFLKRLERVVKRCLAALVLTLCSSLYLIGSVMHRDFKESIASIALIFLSLGMVSGYLPPIAKNRLALDELPRGEDLYLNAKRFCDGDECCAAQALIQSKEIGHPLASAIELGNSKAVEVFIKEGKANPNAVVEGKSFMARAASNLRIDTVRVLFQNGADPENIGGHLTPIVALLLGVRTTLSCDQREFYEKEGRCTPEEMARELVFQGVPFRNDFLQSFASVISAIKEKNRKELANRVWAQNALIEGYRSFLLRHKDKLSDFQIELALCSFGKKRFPHLIYIQTILGTPPNFPNVPIFESKAPEENPSTFTQFGTWVAAFKGCRDNGIVAHFEKVQDALLKAKTEVIWKRAQEITAACLTLPERDIPTLISEYCYS